MLLFSHCYVIYLNNAYRKTFDTCKKQTNGCAAEDLAWMQLEDNKVFLANRGIFFYSHTTKILILNKECNTGV